MIYTFKYLIIFLILGVLTYATTASFSSSTSFVNKEFTTKNILTKLINKQNLSSDETYNIFTQILSSDCDPSIVGAILSTLRAKGETPNEIAGMVKAMKDVCNSVKNSFKCLDIVGTGISLFLFLSFYLSLSLSLSHGLLL